ncbi:helix-turn-helix domain-containing protein [Allorhizobium terrae]|nr:AraC family transcriptional regulator [Allorhizobium terrae]
MNISVAAGAMSSLEGSPQIAGKPSMVGAIAQGGIVIRRVRSEGDDAGKVQIMPRAEAFDISVEMQELIKVKRWHRGRLAGCGAQKQASMIITDLTQDWQVQYFSAFDTVHFHVPFAQLNNFAAETGRPLFTALSCHQARYDPVMFGLARALLPSLDDPATANLLFVERINLAVLAHLSQTYGGMYFPVEKKGTLAPWQERRVNEFLEANFSQSISIADLADVCELSRSYFIKAFKESFGQTPYRWLSKYRVSRCRDMLLGDQAIAEIAIECGFADQSHMTRIFAEFMGLTPGQFRRQNRLDREN